MIRTLKTLIERLLRPSRGNRRGTVLLMALGVLGILSIAAISYVTIVRLDRASAEAGSRRASFQQQPDAVVAHIGGLLTADLFGNKLVSSGDPVEFWPRMFEDGDTRDIPFTDLTPGRISFNTRDSDEDASPNSILTAISNIAPIPELLQRQVAYPDDAWLASTEPDWNTLRWPNITNLRSAYSLNTRISPPQWERDHGRFVDLGEWFLQANQLSAAQFFPNPGVSLMKWNGPGSIPAGRRLGPEMGVNQDVFQYQTNVMSRHINPPESPTVGAGDIDPLTPRDERQWVDTDGDLRPDARWQQLDSLGNLFGLNWVVAARIIDASALINVNTALEFGPSGNADRQADGRTPADVDLYRLIFGAAPISIYSETVQFNQVPEAFRQWINNDLNILGIINDARSLSTTGTGYFSALDNTFMEWTPGHGTENRLRRLEREAFYHYFGSSPQRPNTSRGTAVPIRDLIDLAAFSATNNLNLVSYTEQRFDGPEVGGYLPDGSPVGNFGPMRSRELPENIRAFAQVPESATNQRPSNDQIKQSTRRFLTTVSGDAPFSPVPVLNTTINSAYRGANLNTKIPLDRPLTDETTRAAFESFVWALAPLATNLPLDRDLRNANAFNLGLAEFHYGGGPDGPAQIFREMKRFFPPVTGTAPAIALEDTDASFAVVTAASLAANLKDALDADGWPSVLRVFAQPYAAESSFQLTAGTRPTTLTRPLLLNTEFSHGSIDSVLNPNILKAVGAPVAGLSTADATRGGITVVGLERQPFLYEVTTLTFYSDFAEDENISGGGAYPGGNGNHIVENIPQEELGSAIIIEIVNPWSTPIELNGYSVVIPEDPDTIGSAFTVTLPNSFTLASGARTKFHWLLDDGLVGSWAEIRAELLGQDLFNGVELTDDALSHMPDAANLRIPFRHVLEGDHARPVLLVFDRRTIDLPPHPGYVVDRMAPDDGVIFPEGIGAGFDLSFDGDVAEDVGTQLTFDDYYVPLGYFESGGPPAFNNRSRVENREVTGRVMVTSSLSRAGAQSLAEAGIPSGFPSYVLEIPNANHVVTRKEGHAWIWPFIGSAANPEPSTSRLFPIDLIVGTTVNPVNFPDDHSTIGSTTKFADGTQTPMDGRVDVSRIPSFQLYVPMPDGPTGTRLNALSELHMLSAHAHTCRTFNTLSPNAWEDELDDLRNWQTVGEKIGLSLLRDFNLLTTVSDPSTPGSGYPSASFDINPYPGTLDPTRFTLNDGSLGDVINLPDTMAIPLALRVFDCFWPASLNAELGQGRININTAPREVLQCLPLVDPTFPVGGGGGPLPAGQAGGRLDTMIRYRDPDTQGSLKNSFSLPALRQEVSNFPLPRGYISTGELAILDEWDPGTGQIVNGAIRWAQMADSSVTAIGSPLEMVTDYADPSFNPVNDPEERLALYRAVSNIVSTRSDVFIAWFIVRGYQPAAMERIPINDGSNQSKIAAMDSDDEPFRPAYESRWLVVFDRSNVRRPTDRPRVLLQVELPRATP